MKPNLGSVHYFSTIRKITVAFGQLFDGVKIEHRDANGALVKTIKVPLGYGPKQRWYAVAKAQNSGTDGFVTRTALPRLTFELTDIAYDKSRQTQNMQMLRSAATTGPNALLSQLNSVPYDFGFNVSVITKNIDDFLQIIEQILPQFGPDSNITIHDVPQMDFSRDVPVIFGGITYDNPYEVSNFDEELKFVTGTLKFVCKGYLYRPVDVSAIIKHVTVNLRDDDTGAINSAYTADVDPDTALPGDTFTILEQWTDS